MLYCYVKTFFKLDNEINYNKLIHKQFFIANFND